jgi:hypothetical protein
VGRILYFNTDRINMKVEETPEWIPYSVHIYMFLTDSEKEPKSLNPLEKLYRTYGGVHSEGFDSLEMRSGEVISSVRRLEEGNSQIILLASGPVDTHREAPNHIPEFGAYDGWIDRLRDALTKEPEFTVHIHFAYATDMENAESIFQRYLEREWRPMRSVGLVRGCLLASLRGPGACSIPDTSREFMAVHIGRGPKESSGAAWSLCSEISSLARHSVEMIRLYSGRRLMFEQLDASERSTQLRINEILAEMRRPVDEIQPGDLEEILREITIQFSRLSTIASTMRRDQVKAQGLIRGMRNLLERWNERPHGERLTNSSAELNTLENLLAPFKDFIERTEALMTQLNTVLDSVRTYLGIQQQKLSIMEQASSREQLIRLVNLQEILHKLEILIVAVYLTEMARIIFETSFHELANLLTALFIPIAILISVLISRMLHKDH